MGTSLASDPILWFFIICIWSFIFRCSFCLGLQFNVLIQRPWVLARTH
uniref:ORF47j n=1 Tax=Pinus koraiensis TaxID=88728 RepID=A4QM82_PINKO|nr:ORF47j [Pinus koraiensis]